MDFGSNSTFNFGDSSKEEEEDKEESLFSETSKDAFQFGDSDDKKDALFPSNTQGNESRKCGIGGRRVPETNLQFQKFWEIPLLTQKKTKKRKRRKQFRS